MEHHQITRFGPDSGIVGYWGPPSASIDWCESNYVVSYYIAEFWNCISSFLMAFYGILGLVVSFKHKLLLREWRGIIAHSSVVVVGLGSAYFHGTLLYTGQMWDEIPMMWCALTWMYILFDMDSPYAGGNMKFGLGIFVYSVAASLIHYMGAYTTAFQVHFGILTVIGTMRMFYERSRMGEHDFSYMPFYFVFGFLLSFGLWLIDQIFCNQLHALPLNPQFHAIWHVLNALNIHHGVQYTTWVRLTKLGMKPKKVYYASLPFFYPTVPPTRDHQA
jgi:dihydroceramidase